MHDRFYCETLTNPIELRNDEFHHLRVMRVRVGEEIELIDGRGTLAIARLEEVLKNSAYLTIIHQETHPHPTSSIIIVLPLIRLERLEWAIEKGTELNAESFYLFPADYSEKNELSAHQLERLGHIAISAIKQCGRLYLPEIIFKTSLEEALFSNRQILFGDTDPAAPLLASHPHSPILFVSGPEKGFSSRELEFLKQHGKGVKLHQNILRAETAPLVALSRLEIE